MEAITKKVSLFYFFSVLDDRKALAATTFTCKKISELELATFTPFQINSLIINLTYEYWAKKSQTGGQFFGRLPTGPLWSPPRNLNLGPWRELVKKYSQQEYQLYLIWKFVLEFSHEEIAAGLGISEGSVRFRIAKGLRLLGEIIPFGPNENGVRVHD